MSILPGLNYDSKLSVDDLAFASNATEEAILERIKAVFGSYSITTPRYGIADVINPRDVVSSDTTRPLMVYQSSANPLLVDVVAGTAITANGSIVTQTESLINQSLVRTLLDDIIVVFIENEIIDSPPTRITRYNTSQDVRRTQSDTKIRSALLSDYQNAELFPPTRVENIVVLAVVTVIQTVSGTLDLKFDYTNTNYSFVRPWFSPVDIEHRSYIGSGTPTTRNPHGTTFNDLVSGALTLYDQLIPIGMIQARDDDFKGVPGTICIENIDPGRILTDISGAITGASRFGGVGKKYVVLAKTPVQITAFYFATHKGRSVAFDWIAGTRIVVIPAPENISIATVIEYAYVESLAPPTTYVSSLTFSPPLTSKELIVSGGISVDQLINPTLDFTGSGPVPRNYDLYVDDEGKIIRAPDIVLTPLNLENLGTSQVPITYTLLGPCKISIGLADAAAIPSMEIVIEIFGKDSNNASISEELTFNGSTWTPVSLPGADTPTQRVESSQTFYDITAFQVKSRANDGIASRIVIFAEYETGTTLALNKYAKAATCLWDGLSISPNSLVDMRRIEKNIPPVLNRYSGAGQLAGTGGTDPLWLFSEDLAAPKYRNSAKSTQDAVAATATIFVNNYIQISAGDTIQFPNGKALVAVLAGTPNRVLGQYLVSSSNSDTRDDMVLTINTSGFNCGFIAVADPSISNKITLTSTTLGARGNGQILEPVEANPGAVLVTASSGGIDSYGETYISRHEDYMSTVIPNVSTYDVSGLRNRYESVPVAINPSRTSVIIKIHGLTPPTLAGVYGVQVRARIATGAISDWLPWQVLTGDGGVFVYTEALGISKIQLDIFGKFSGYSLFEAN